MYPEKRRSNFWFLLPIFLGLIGGIIAYFVLRHDDPQKAKNCLYLGIILAVIGIVLNLTLASELTQLEQNFGIDPISSLGNDGSNGDTDGDGFTHIEEFEAGTNPNDSTDLPSIVAHEIDGADIRITIATVTDKIYQLQFRDSLTEGSWTNVGPAVVGDDQKQVLIDQNGALAPVRFYRVRISLQ